VDSTGDFDTGPIRERHAAQDREQTVTLLAQNLARREARIAELEAEIDRLKHSRAEETALDPGPDGLADSLRRQHAEHEAAVARQRGEIERLVTELNGREQRLATVLAELEQEREKALALEDDARVLQQQLSVLEAIEEEEPRGLFRRGSKHDAELKRLRAEAASLSQHIENRNRIWRDQGATLAATRTRVRELELELAQRFRRQAIAENRAEAEAQAAQRAREKLTAALQQLERARERSRQLGGRRPGVTEDEPMFASLEPSSPEDVIEPFEPTMDLTAELQDHPNALHRLYHLESTILDLQTRMSSQLEDDTALFEPTAGGALICLTGDKPMAHSLDKPVTTIGRGRDCDIHIVTHYVSREHARITLTNGSAVIEDLGSRNGVFVNAVRVDRHTLEQNDLVTIGDAQFRYESSATR
jgi:myosin heavy subunit